MEAKETLERWIGANSASLLEAGIEATVVQENHTPNFTSIHLGDNRCEFALCCGLDGPLFSYWQDAVIEIMRGEQEYKPEDSVDEIMAKGLKLVKRYPNKPQWKLSGSKGLVKATYLWVESNGSRLLESGLPPLQCFDPTRENSGEVVELIVWRFESCVDFRIWDNGQAGKIFWNLATRDFQTSRELISDEDQLFRLLETGLSEFQVATVDNVNPWL